MSQLDDALMRLYENADLRDELTDDEATRLLQWAEAELARLDAAGADDDAFEAQVDTLLRLLKQVNRYAGRQGQGFAAQSLAQDVDPAPGRIAELATALGHAADSQQIAAAGTGEPGSTVDALTALMTPSDAPTDAPQNTLETTPDDEPIDQA